MGAKPGGGWTTETLGDLIDTGGRLSHYCASQDCRRALDCDIYDLAIWFGRRQRFVETRLPLRCSGCGGTDIRGTVSSESRPHDAAMRGEPGNFRSSRTEEERRALMLIFPRR